MQRGNNRTPVFRGPDEFRTYLALLQAASAVTTCAVHAYVLMTNHVHLLVTPADVRGTARLMKIVSQGYARWFNARHRRTGTLWEGRYRSSLIGSERYLLTCYRYIDLNPVRARMVPSPRAYPWSSAQTNAWGDAASLVTPHPRYLALGATAPERQAAYRALLGAPLPDHDLAVLRRATHTRTALGDPAALEELARRFARPLAPRPHGGDRRSAAFRETRYGEIKSR